MAYLQQQSQNEMMAGKVSEYNNIYNPLVQSVAYAKQQHQGMAEYNMEDVDDGSHEKIIAKKMALDNMLRDYVGEKQQEKKLKKKSKELKKRNKRRDARIERIRLGKFNSQLKNKQMGRMKKRDAQQVKLCMRIYQLASNLEKKKLIDEKKQAKKERDSRRKKKM